MPVRTRVTVKWLGDGKFKAFDDQGNSVIMEASSLRKEGEGDQDSHSLSPSQLLLAAVGGCSSVDVVSILLKRRKKLDGLEVEVVGERVDGYPTRYSEISLRYVTLSSDVNTEDLEKSVQLSMEKYCSVSLTIKNGAKITTECQVQRKNA
jgi:putative redox protein